MNAKSEVVDASAPIKRWGITVPFDGIALADQGDVVRRVADAGYTDLWSSEASGADAFTPLALASVWAPSLRLGTAIVPAFTRGPALMAQSIGSMAEAAPGRFVFGIGTSSNVIVEQWNGLRFAEPYRQTRDMVRFLRQALTGEKVSGTFGSSSVHGFRLGTAPAPDVPIYVAALRPGMLRLAGREGDGVIINWLSAEDVRSVVPVVAEAARGVSRDVVARIFVLPTTDREAAMALGRRVISAYLNVPVYAEFHRWLGRGDRLAPMWDAWASGDRRAALAAIGEDVVSELIVWGTPEQCREHIERYVDAGVTTPVIALLPGAYDLTSVIGALAPTG